MRTTERVAFRLFDMPCCGMLLCWPNHRYPSYCPNCGKYVFDRIKGCVLVADEDARLVYDDGQK
jgi:NADH pyrophosphatase NudC (nudix superfamily)